MDTKEKRFFAELAEVVADARDEADCSCMEPDRLLELADELNMTGLLCAAGVSNRLKDLSPALFRPILDRYDDMHRSYHEMLKRASEYFARLKKAGVTYMLTGEAAIHKMMNLYGCFRKTEMEILVPPGQREAAVALLKGAPVTVESAFRRIEADVASARSFRDDNCVEACLLALDMCASMPQDPDITKLRDLYFVMMYAEFDYGLLYQLARCMNVAGDCRRVFKLMAEEFPTVKLENGLLNFIC